MVMRPIVYRSLRPLNSYLTSFHMSVYLPVDLLDRSVAPGTQILRFARQDHTTIIEEHDVVKEAFNIGNHLRRQDHRAVSAEVGYQRIQDLDTRQGIQPSEGLVQDVEPCRHTDIALRKTTDLYEHAHFFSFLAVSAAIAVISSDPYPSERMPATYVATMSRASPCRLRSTVPPSPDTKVPMPRCVATYPSRSSSR